ncbi:MAG: Gfo/Idh/MocA family oxidoreductase [Sedimentisphaerales bacterium]
MKVLIVGLGSIGQRHLRNLRQLFGDELEILAYRSIGKNIKISENMTIENDVDLESAYRVKIYSDYREILEQKPDAAIIANPTKLHMSAALEAANLGCHLFIEKPISTSLTEIDKLESIVKEKQLIVMVGYQLRFHPCLQLINELLRQKKIGALISVFAEFGEYLPNAHPYEDYRKGYAARKDLGGGVLFSLSHEFDYLQWLFGMPRRLLTLGGKLSTLEMDVEDTSSILMENVVDGRKLPIHVHLDFLQDPASRNFRIIGEKGKISWDYYSNKVELQVGRKQNWETFDFNPFERNKLFLDEMSYFMDCIKMHKQTIVDIHEGIKSLRIALAAKRSMETMTVVEDI